MYKILLLEGDKNDATLFYLEILKETILKIGCQIKYVENIAEINQGDRVIVITPKAFLKIKQSGKADKVMHWYQGVVSEEVMFYDYSWLKKRIMNVIYSLLEGYAIKKSDFNFFVSNAMLNYYTHKYGYKKRNYYIMPCFNQSLLDEAFYDEKYQKPSFVYTGNLAKWQCFEPMLKLYKEISTTLPESTLTIYTKDKEKAGEMLRKYGVEAVIKYVPYLQLSDEIKQFKYGFLLREDNIVNNVATPTKMNSYLSNGIIPIYTDVVESFKTNLKDIKYQIPLRTDGSGLEKLFEFEKQTIQACKVKMDFEKAFLSYYNRDFYINSLSDVLKILDEK